MNRSDTSKSDYSKQCESKHNFRILVGRPIDFVKGEKITIKLIARSVCNDVIACEITRYVWRNIVRLLLAAGTEAAECAHRANMLFFRSFSLRISSFLNADWGMSWPSSCADCYIWYIVAMQHRNNCLQVIHWLHVFALECFAPRSRQIPLRIVRHWTNYCYARNVRDFLFSTIRYNFRSIIFDLSICRWAPRVCA